MGGRGMGELRHAQERVGRTSLLNLASLAHVSLLSRQLSLIV
jgi:hypothetical protein